MISKHASRSWRLASSVVLLLNQGLALAQGTRSLTQFGIAEDCNAFVRANAGDICYDTALENRITLAQLSMWNPVLGPDGKDCPTQFLAGYSYCVGVSENVTANPNSAALAPQNPSSFTLNATNATLTHLQHGTAIAAFNGSFYIGLDPAVACKNCPPGSDTTVVTVGVDNCASLAPRSGGQRIFVSTSSGALSYVTDVGGKKSGEKGNDRMEKGFKYTEGGFIGPRRGIFEFGVLPWAESGPLGWEACEVKGMEGVWRIFVQGIGRGIPGEADRGGKAETCVEFLAAGTGV